MALGLKGVTGGEWCPVCGRGRSSSDRGLDNGLSLDGLPIPLCPSSDSDNLDGLDDLCSG